MDRRKFFIILSILFFLVSGLFWSEEITQIAGKAGRGVGSVLASPVGIVTNIGKAGELEDAARALTLENEALKKEIALLKESVALASGTRVTETHVFSSYPFNHRNLLLIEGGEDRGFKPGSGVAVHESILVGAILEVFPRTSSVRTIFDPDMSLPVKIGSAGVNALLVGGRIPRLTLIDKEASVLPGDEVSSSGSGFPYGLHVGKVLDVSKEAGSGFQEASLKIPYDIGALTEVSIFIL